MNMIMKDSEKFACCWKALFTNQGSDSDVEASAVCFIIPEPFVPALTFVLSYSNVFGEWDLYEAPSAILATSSIVSTFKSVIVEGN